jgi:hypothetical protein
MKTSDHFRLKKENFTTAYHNKLLKKDGWYSNWHKQPSHHCIHYFLFFITLINILSVVYNAYTIFLIHADEGCESPQILVDGICTEPTPPLEETPPAEVPLTCESPQILVDGICTEPTPPLEETPPAEVPSTVEEENILNINSEAGIILNQSDDSTNITEGGNTDNVSILLNSKPTSDVTIPLTLDGQVTADKTALVFNDSNWYIPQIITLSAVDDSVVEGPSIRTYKFTSSSADLNYNNLTSDPLVINISDNDFYEE